MTTTTRACLLAASLLLVPLPALASGLPAQGMSMDEVRARFGAPAYDLGAVGSPAITRWVYDGYTVYFEGRRVLHAVQTQPLAGTPAPRSANETATVAPAPAAIPPVAPVTRRAEPAPAPVPVQAPAPVPVTAAPALPPAAEAIAPSPAAPASAEIAAPTPAPVPAAGPAPKPASSGFYFDPVTGRLVLDGDAPPAAAPTETPAPAATPEPATAPPAGARDPGKASDNLGTALDETLEFDPETGTFRSVH